MALDFPASPVDGQVYGNYIYSSSKAAWQARPLEPAVTITSPTPPANPSNGDMWFNTSNGTTYVYYNDSNTSQWVEMLASTGIDLPVSIAQGGTGSTTVADARTALGLGGTVLQVVPATIGIATTVAATTFQDTALTASITPSSASSKVLVLASFAMQVTGAPSQAYYTIFRGTAASGTNLGDATSGLGRIDTTQTLISNVALQVLDSPSTATAQQYTVAIRRNTGTNTLLGGNSVVSTLTLLEIGG